MTKVQTIIYKTRLSCSVRQPISASLHTEQGNWFGADPG